MLITTSLAAVVLASALSGAAAPGASALPPMSIAVSASTAISPTLVTRVLAEADAVWRGAGLTFAWRRERDATDARAIPARALETGPGLTPTLRVVIGSGEPADAERRSRNTTALGWIVFDAGAPAPEIYLSYDNAQAYMANAREVVGLIDRMPIAEREMLLGRAMGRALAHELGHYLLASKVHTQHGLMRASHTATEFFAFERSSFGIDAGQREAVVERLRQNVRIAMHDPQ